MDESDMATQREIQDREVCIKYNRKPELPANGFCYNCGDDCHGCFCDADCRSDYEQRRKFTTGKQ